MDHHPGGIIIPNYNALIFHLLKSNCGNYILCLCSLPQHFRSLFDIAC